MAQWNFPSFILLWDEHWETVSQQGFFQVPNYPKPEYIPLNHPSDLSKVTQTIENNINRIDIESSDEARKQVKEQRLAFVGDNTDYGHYYSYRYRATVHGVPDEKWMTDFVNGELTQLLERYIHSVIKI